MRFHDKLRELRHKRGLTQEQLAREAGMPTVTLRGHEQGQRLPSWISVVRLSRALGVPTDVFSECVDEETVPGRQKRPPGKPKKPTSRSR
jgi:transcriptional regulator with XRE-family HTH domain